MRQVIQNYKTGELRLEEVPRPVCRPGGVLVRNAFSVISLGTEKMKVDQARMSLVQKARARPDHVQKVLQNVKQQGLVETVRKVKDRLEAPTPLGYSCAGVVEEVGAGVEDFRVGHRVACGGAGYANHADFVFVPRNLCVPVPDEVDLRHAALATVGSIALQGVRQARVTLGDRVMVIGLGLVGQLCVQLLNAAGARVLGIDLDSAKIDRALAAGADKAHQRSAPGLADAIKAFSDGAGVDAVISTAAAPDNDPAVLAGQSLRDRGRLVILGMSQVDLPYKLFYEKEIDVRFSRSYGPGRYDRNYEEKGIDYPMGYVRWTERRNLASFIEQIERGRVNLEPLITQTFPFEEAEKAYDKVHQGGDLLGILFQYGDAAEASKRVAVAGGKAASAVQAKMKLGVIGAGNFFTSTLLPHFKRDDRVRLRGIASASGFTAQGLGQKSGFEFAASGSDEILDDAEVDTVVIATRHDSHGALTLAAMKKGKNVFVEKPLALTEAELEEIAGQAVDYPGKLMVGFNRRFSPHAEFVKDAFPEDVAPIEVLIRVNAGAVAPDHWYQDPDEGGGRIVGEVCHFLDLLQYLTGSTFATIHAETVTGSSTNINSDCVAVSMRMRNGSLGSIFYVAGGDPSFPKERVEVFGGGKVAVIDNFRRSMISEGGRTRNFKTTKQDKGHGAEVKAFVDAVCHGDNWPIALEEMYAASSAPFRILESIGRGSTVTID